MVIVMIKPSPTAIIREARELQQNATLSLSEMTFLIIHSEISDIAKLIWLWFAMQSVNDREFSYRFSYFQLIQIVNQPCVTIHDSILQLQNMGFIHFTEMLPSTMVSTDLLKQHEVGLCLPMEGLLMLKRSK